MKKLISFLWFTITLVCSSDESAKYENYARQFFHLENQILMKDAFNKEYLFEALIKNSKISNNFAVYRYNEVATNSSLDISTKNYIQIDVFTIQAPKDHNKRLSFEFTKFYTSSTLSSEENTKIFFQMFEKIYTYSPFETKIRLKDTYQPHDTKHNILKSNLKFRHFFKYGKTFFEKFNFQYVVKIPMSLRTLKDEGLLDLKNICSKYPRINTPQTISDLVLQFETYYSDQEVDLILIDLFFATDFKKLFSTFPVDMIYQPSSYLAENRQSIYEKSTTSEKKFISKIFFFNSKISDKENLLDNFL